MSEPSGGRRTRWLVLNSNASGPFRAIFSSPAAADDILLSDDHDIMVSFTRLATEDLDRLQVGPLDEP